jgi:DNA polymerase V
MSIPIPLSISAPLELIDVGQRVQAGFPSPAQDHQQRRIDLNEILVLNPLSTFLFRVSGDSMIDARIYDGDQLIVDRSVEALPGRIVLACVDGEFTVKVLRRHMGRMFLQPANAAYEAIRLHDGQELTIWGVVTWNLRQILHDKVGRQ